MILTGKSVVVTGGSRGLEFGSVEALVAQGARVAVVARGAEDLESVRRRLGVAIYAADIADADAAGRILAETNPDVLLLNAGAVPRMAPFDEIGWADFSVPWETDVKGALYWLQAALRLPLAPGSRVLVASSGAAIGGSPLSGGYAGAKRTLWFMADYANKVADRKSLKVRFQVIVPQQMVDGTGVGDVGAEGYAKAAGVAKEAILAKMGTPMPPRLYGDYIVSALTDAKFEEALVLGAKGDRGLFSIGTSP